MLSVVRDKDERIIGYLEWAKVDQAGRDSDTGEYIAIKGGWIHRDYRRHHLLYTLARQIYFDQRTQDCKYVYWEIVRGFQGKKLGSESGGIEVSRKVSKTYTKLEIMMALKNDKNVKRYFLNK